MPDNTSNTLLQPAPSTSRLIDANGVRLHLLDYGGEGKRPLLCLHGGGAHAHWFDFVASAFTADFHVLSLDQRGHGDSAWAEPPEYNYDNFIEDLQAIVKQLDPKGIALMGHSMGGMISLMHTSRYPASVRGLVIIDSTMNISPDFHAAMKQRGSHPGKAYASQEAYVADFRLRPEKTMARPEVLRHVAMHATRQFEESVWRHKIDRRIMGNRTATDGVPLWSRVTMPALLIKAGMSERVSPPIIAGIRANCPHVELVEVPDSEHHVTLDNPAGLRPVVSAFLRKHFPQG